MRLGVSGDAEAPSPLRGSIIVSGDGGAVQLANAVAAELARCGTLQSLLTLTNTAHTLRSPRIDHPLHWKMTSGGFLDRTREDQGRNGIPTIGDFMRNGSRAAVENAQSAPVFG
jgi:hypothetical protein